MKLTSEQSDAVSHDGNAVVVACPGSGKTRAIIAKLLRAVDAVRDTPRRVACITYTNTAVYEIDERIRAFGSGTDEEYCNVSTIHAFCQNNVLRHYFWKLGIFGDGYSVLPSDCDEYREIVDLIGDKFDIGEYPRGQFEMLNRHPDGTPITPDGISSEAANAFWKELQERGYVDFCNVVYLSYCLLRDHSSLVESLAAKFATILVDEFQDTSALQVEILRLIHGVNLTTFFLVGDPEQSIYRFAGAERELMFKFSGDIGATEFHLSGNFRCGPKIVAMAQTLISRKPEMESRGDATNHLSEPLYYDTGNIAEAIFTNFIPTVDQMGIRLGNAAVLSPNWFDLRAVGIGLRNRDVPLIGPGSRPYRKSHLFASLAEQVCAYVEKPSPKFVREGERELFNLVQNVTGKPDFRVFSFKGRKALFHIFDDAEQVRKSFESVGSWLHTAAVRIGDTLVEEDFLPKSAIELLTQSADDMIRDMIKNGVDLENMTLAQLGVYASPEDNLRLLTLHKSKGREFDAVAMVALQDGKIPFHNKYNALTNEGLSEARRLFYVGITRARRLLMFFSQAGHYLPASRFLGEIYPKE